MVPTTSSDHRPHSGSIKISSCPRGIESHNKLRNPTLPYIPGAAILAVSFCLFPFPVSQSWSVLSMQTPFRLGLNEYQWSRNSMVNRFSIVTLVIFFLSAGFVIRPVSITSVTIWKKKRRLWLSLNTAPIIAIAILWASQCLGPTQIRRGIVGTGSWS